MIKVYFLMAFLILLSRSVQVSSQKINIFVSGTSNSKTAGMIENILENEIQTLLSKQYPCASALTDDDATVFLEWARQRELMGNPDEDAISNVAGALGGQFLVSVNVTQVNSTFAMNVSGIDNRRGKPVSRQGAVANSDGEATGVAVSLAEKFVSDFINSLPDCYQNEWIGTITYKRETRGESRTTENHLVFNEVKKTTEITSKAVVDAEFEVRGTKRPARAFVKCTEERTINISLSGTVKCGAAIPGDPERTVPLNSTDMEKITGNAEGRSDEGRASVSVDGDEFTISVMVPAIEGGTSVRDWTLKDSGGCGDPVDTHETTSISWTTYEEYGQANGTIDPTKPDVLTGSKTIKIPSPTGIQETKIITWNLSFKRDPSTKK